MSNNNNQHSARAHTELHKKGYIIFASQITAPLHKAEAFLSRRSWPVLVLSQAGNKELDGPLPSLKQAQDLPCTAEHSLQPASIHQSLSPKLECGEARACTGSAKCPDPVKWFVELHRIWTFGTSGTSARLTTFKLGRITFTLVVNFLHSPTLHPSVI